MATILLHQHTLHGIRVIDGDTLEAWLDHDDVVRVKRRIRLRGVEAGEMDELQGQRARHLLQKFLNDHATQSPRLIGNLHHLDQHGRIVADVGFDNGETLVALCLRSGYWWRRTRSGSQPGAMRETPETQPSAEEKHQ